MESKIIKSVNEKIESLSNSYIFKIDGGLERNYITLKTHSFLLNEVILFNSKNGEILFSSSNGKFRNLKNNLSRDIQIKFDTVINRRLKINLNKKEFFICPSNNIDHWTNTKKYNLYLDINLLNDNYKLNVHHTETPTDYKEQKELILFDIYYINSYITSTPKPLEDRKNHEINKLKCIIKMFEECKDEKQLEKLKDEYTSKFYISDSKIKKYL